MDLDNYMVFYVLFLFNAFLAVLEKYGRLTFRSHTRISPELTSTYNITLLHMQTATVSYRCLPQISEVLQPNYTPNPTVCRGLSWYYPI
jgi:hypothetical protein